MGVDRSARTTNEPQSPDPSWAPKGQRSGADFDFESDDLALTAKSLLKTRLLVDRCVLLLVDDGQRLIDPSAGGLAGPASGLSVRPGSALDAAFSGDCLYRTRDDLCHRLNGTPEAAFCDLSWVELALPLRVSGALAALVLTDLPADATTLRPDIIAQLELIALTLSTVLHRRQLLEVLRHNNAESSQLSQELMRIRSEERGRIARDLHDDLIQPLIAASYAVAMLADPGAEDVRKTLAELVDRARTICFELREPALDNLGFGAAARAVISAFTKRTGVAVSARIAESATLSVPEAISSAALGVLDEALTNAAKHALATRIVVDVEACDGALALTIQDNGPGFDIANVRHRAADQRQFGLAIMDERAASVGGCLSIRSSTRHGSRVEARFPIETR